MNATDTQPDAIETQDQQTIEAAELAPRIVKRWAYSTIPPLPVDCPSELAVRLIMRALGDPLGERFGDDLARRMIQRARTVTAERVQGDPVLRKPTVLLTLGRLEVALGLPYERRQSPEPLPAADKNGTDRELGDSAGKYDARLVARSAAMLTVLAVADAIREKLRERPDSIPLDTPDMNTLIPTAINEGIEITLRALRNAAPDSGEAQRLYDRVRADAKGTRIPARTFDPDQFDQLDYLRTAQRLAADNH